MSHEIFVYAASRPDAEQLAGAITKLFKKARVAIEPPMYVTLDLRGGEASTAFEVDAQERSASELLDDPLLTRAKRKRLSSARWSFTVPFPSGDDVFGEAAAWALAAALADAGDGLVNDPGDGEWRTAAEAKRAATRLLRESSAPPIDRELDPWERRELEAEAAYVAGVQLDKKIAHLVTGPVDAIAAWVPGAPDDAITQLLASLCEERVMERMSIAASAMGAERLGRVLERLAASGGFRTVATFELLGESGALDVLDETQRRAIVGCAREWKNRDLIEALARRGWPAS
jgi:hypothetical protein